MKKKETITESAWGFASGRKKMPKKIALIIKDLRVNKGASWRLVADKITNGETSNQILGMELCKTAMILLKEKEKDGWN